METASEEGSSSDEEQKFASKSGVKHHGSPSASKPIFCSMCDKQFALKSSLNRHFKMKHLAEVSVSEVRNEVATNNREQFKCSECPQQFCKLKYLNNHKKKTHSISIVPPLKQHVCPLCKQSFYGKEILTHFQSFHDIDIEIEVMQFDNLEAFMAWKKVMEAETKSFFRKSSRHVWKSKEKTNHHFICHRSGESASSHISETKLAKIRINAYCPASIKVEEFKEGKCSVTFMQTHVGHEETVHQTNLLSQETASEDMENVRNVFLVENISRNKDSNSRKTDTVMKQKSMQFKPIVNFSNKEIDPGLPDEEGKKDGKIFNSICTSVACIMLNQQMLTQRDVHDVKGQPQMSSHLMNNDSSATQKDFNSDHNAGSDKNNLIVDKDGAKSLSDLKMNGDANQTSSNVEENFCSSNLDNDAANLLTSADQRTQTLEERRDEIIKEFSEFVHTFSHQEEVRAAEILLEVLKDTITIIGDGRN